MPEATMYHGEYRSIDYTPGSDIAAGEVVILGGATGLGCGIAHRAIPANTKGALAIGGAVYIVTSSGAAVAPNAKVYWDNATNKVTITATGNATFGYVVGDGGAADGQPVKVFHWPFGTT